jgi:hypothetical protein
MLTITELNRFNDSLLANYGRLWDKQKYKLSWTNDCFEQRYVEGRQFLEGSKGKVFLHDVKGIINTPKYPRDRDRYVLEILVEVPHQLWEELVEHISYEPLHVFKNTNNNQYREPNWFILNALASLSHYPVEQAVMNVFELMRHMDQKDYEHSLDILNNELPDLAIALKKGSAVFLNSAHTFKPGGLIVKP